MIDIDYYVNQLQKDHLIICCPTAIEGINDKDTDLFHLKRLMVN